MITTVDYLVLVIVTGLVFTSSYNLIINPKSIRQRLMQRYFSEEAWEASESEESQEIREYCRDLASSAATMGGIGLAIVAFLMSGVFVNASLVTSNLSFSVGVSFILMSALVEFWAFSQLTIVSARSSSERASDLARGNFKFAFYLQIYGVYFFLVGFVWALATFNIYFSFLFALGYVATYLASLIIVPRLGRRSKRSSQSDAK